MSTNSLITVKVNNSEFHSVYCHWDGGLDHVGKILKEHYTTLASVLKLIEGGDISSLGKSCDTVEGHTFDTPVDDLTVYYGRDRGETGVDKTISDNIETVVGYEYNYLFDSESGEWLYSEDDDTNFTKI